MRRALVFVLLFTLHCSDDAAPPGGDAGAFVCASALDCDDGLYCNGAEACDPTSADANSRGCIAGFAPCATPDLCVASMMRCMDDGCMDADGDGHADAACGGDDCDDGNASRYPGNAERCDFEDDDCDPSTVGDRDADGDGVVSNLCCNGDLCGRDCDDREPGTNPTSPEVCDGIDRDCDGSIDEGVSLEVYPDTDRDGFGDAASSPEIRCGLTSDRASRAGDCDDLDPDRNPSVVEVCDGVDQDCDGMVDEGTDESCDELLGEGTLGACITPPDGGAPRCHGLRCDEGFGVCGESADNRCDAAFCESGPHCGHCGNACFMCQADGSCEGGGAVFAQRLRWDFDELVSGDGVIGATLESRELCMNAIGVTPEGRMEFFRFENPDSPGEGRIFGVRLSAEDLPTHVFDPLPALASDGSQAFPVVTEADLDRWYEAAGRVRDPELGTVVLIRTMVARESIISDAPFVVNADGTTSEAPAERTFLPAGALVVLPNALPGTYPVAALTSGCRETPSSTHTCVSVDALAVEGGAVSVRDLRCTGEIACTL